MSSTFLSVFRSDEGVCAGRRSLVEPDDPSQHGSYRLTGYASANFGDYRCRLSDLPSTSENGRDQLLRHLVRMLTAA